MRLRLPFNALFGLMIGVSSALCLSSHAADENRYKGWIEENVFYRFDNQTGEIYKLVKPATGAAIWMKCDIVEPKPQVAKTPHLQTLQLPPETCIPQPNVVRPQPSAAIVEPDTLNPDRRVARSGSAPRQIEVWNEFGKNITNEIDDADRTGCRSVINGYDALHVSHTLKTTGDRIKGIIILDNKGSRKIAMMELTMTVRVIGKDKPIAHKRFIFTDKADSAPLIADAEISAHTRFNSTNKADTEKPPAPSNGLSGMSVLKSVDIPTPSGVINGMPEISVTFIRFDDKE